MHDRMITYQMHQEIAGFNGNTHRELLTKRKGSFAHHGSKMNH